MPLARPGAVDGDAPPGPAGEVDDSAGVCPDDGEPLDVETRPAEDAAGDDLSLAASSAEEHAPSAEINVMAASSAPDRLEIRIMTRA